MILGRLYDLALWPHPWPWLWGFKVRVWNSFVSGMGWPIDMEGKGVIHSWPWYWLVWPWWGGQMYQIMTGVTSDVGVPSTYLVKQLQKVCRMDFFSKLKNLKFWQSLWICNFDFVLFWLGIQYELVNIIVWVIMGRHGVSSECRHSSYSSFEWSLGHT